MSAKDNCGKCGKTLSKCGTCRGNGKIGSLWGGDTCTECGGTGRLCASHGKRH